MCTCVCACVRGKPRHSVLVAVVWNPGGHWQMYDPGVFTHSPCAQGFLSHSSSSGGAKKLINPFHLLTARVTFSGISPHSLRHIPIHSPRMSSLKPMLHSQRYWPPGRGMHLPFTQRLRIAWHMLVVIFRVWITGSKNIMFLIQIIETKKIPRLFFFFFTSLFIWLCFRVHKETPRKRGHTLFSLIKNLEGLMAQFSAMQKKKEKTSLICLKFQNVLTSSNHHWKMIFCRWLIWFQPTSGLHTAHAFIYNICLDIWNTLGIFTTTPSWTRCHNGIW